MNPSETDLYLVRIWRGTGAFRATARRVDEEALHCVHSAQELADFLAAPPLPAAPARPPSASPAASTPTATSPGSKAP